MILKRAYALLFIFFAHVSFTSEKQEGLLIAQDVTGITKKTKAEKTNIQSFLCRHKGKVACLTAVASACVAFACYVSRATANIATMILWGVGERQGTRDYMEDRHVKPITFTDPSNAHIEYTISAVFDGHGGDKAATFASNNLVETFKKTTTSSSMHERLGQTFDQLNTKIIESGIKDGTTASVCVITKDISTGTTKLHTAHAGDSRIYVAIGEGEAWSSRDHKESDFFERKRLAENNITCERGYARLPDGNGLNVVRGLGDEIFKRFAPKAFIATPDVKEFDITGKTAVILIGSDGLYDALPTWNESFKNILQRTKNCLSLSQMDCAAKELVALAEKFNMKTFVSNVQNKESGTVVRMPSSDNITALLMRTP